jgi:microsomal dipeptidase-like Zn-dependent dipeptidase
MKKLLTILLALLLLVAFGYFVIAPWYVDDAFNRVAELPPYEASAEAEALHEQLFLADLHDDLLLWSRDPLRRYQRGHTDLPRLVEGNVGLQVFSAVTKSPWGQNYENNTADSDRITPLVIGERWPVRTWTSLLERALYISERLYKAEVMSEEQLIVIETADELESFLARRAKEPTLVAGVLATEGLHPLEGHFENLDVLIDAGYRMLGLTHFFDNEVAGSAHGVARGGLTDLGRRVILHMEARHILVDLAHASPQTIDEVLDMTTRPVVVSHTGVQATCPGPRNLSDIHIRRIAEGGGVIGVGFWEGAVCDIAPSAIVRAIRHVVDLVGIEYVALGSDFDGSVRTQFDATGLVLITDALLADGFTEAEVRQIMGENILRLLRETLPTG